MMGNPFGGGLGWGMGGGILMVLFWVAIIALVVWGIKAVTTSGRDDTPQARPSALDIARTRYARGEIGKEEFERIKQHLA